MLIPALYGLINAEWPSSKKYGNTTLNVGEMHGGVAANVLAEEAEAKLLIRIADGQPEDIKKIVQKTLDKTGEKFEVIYRLGYGPVPIDHDVPDFQTIVVNYGTDIPYLKGNHKRYLYGPGSILEAHSAHEHLRVQDLEEAVEGYRKLVKFSLKH
jgi:acetylornithine deacetylase